jgi:hypothetical protein
MKEEHKRLIELIIVKFKEANGYIHSQPFVLLFNDDHKLRASITRIMMKDLNLLENVGTHAYRITKDGWNFTSFQDLENSELKKSEKENIERENLIINTSLNKWFLKTKWLPLLLSLAAIIASVYFNIQDKDKQKELETKIIENEKTIDTLRGEIMILRKQVFLNK